MASTLLDDLDTENPTDGALPSKKKLSMVDVPPIAPGAQGAPPLLAAPTTPTAPTAPTSTPPTIPSTGGASLPSVPVALPSAVPPVDAAPKAPTGIPALPAGPQVVGTQMNAGTNATDQRNVPDVFQGGTISDATQNMTAAAAQNYRGYASTFSDVANQALRLGYRNDNQGNITDPITGQLVGNWNDPSFDITKLQPSTGGIIERSPDDALGAPPAPPITGTPGAVDAAPHAPSLGVPRAVPGGASDVGAGGTAGGTAGAGPTLPVAPSAVAGAGTNTTPTSNGMGNTGASYSTPIDPANPLTTREIQAGPTADRFKIAQDRWSDFVKSSDPAYQASLRDANRTAAAGGALGSGMLNTSIGNLALRRGEALDTQGRGFLNDALTGSIDDAYKNAGIAEEQQGFQAGRQDTAFNQDVVLKQLEEALKNGQFGRDVTKTQLGYQNDPSDMLMMLSALTGQQGTAAQKALTDYIRSKSSAGGGTGATTGASGNIDWQALIDWYKQQSGGGVPSTGTATNGGDGMTQ